MIQRATRQTAKEYPGPKLVSKSGASTQVENGDFTRIHNDILMSLTVSPLNGLELRLVLFLLRMTYGWQRKETELSYNDFATATNSSRSVVIRYLNKLQAKQVVQSSDNGYYEARTWRFNKYVEQWKLSSDEEVTSDQLVTTPSDQLVTTPSDQLVTTPSDQLVTTPSDQLVTHTTKKELKKDLKKTKDNNSGGRRQTDPEFGIICERYEQEIGMMSSIIADSLGDLLDEYKDHRMILDAIGVAVKANKRTLRYVEGVLRNMRAEGKDGNHAGNQRGYSAGNGSAGKQAAGTRAESRSGIGTVPEAEANRIRELLARNNQATAPPPG